MMLSSRRLWCGLTLCLLVVTTMLVEPVRGFVQRCACRYAFGNTFSAGEIHFHRKRELLEIENFQVNRVSDRGEVHVWGDLGLIKFDMPRLLDKRFDSTKVKLQGVRIELAAAVLTPSGTPVSAIVASTRTWQANLARLLTELGWENVRDGFESLVTTDQLFTDFDSKARGWLLRSQQIVFHADQLTQSIQSYSNPLRHLNEIRNQIQQLEQLRVEQVQLQKQFSAIDTMLAEQLNVVRQESERDLGALRTKTDLALRSLQSQVAEQLVDEWSHQLLIRPRMLAQSADALFQQATRTSPFDVNVRSLSANNPLVSIAEIEADGHLVDALSAVPFTATGSYALRQANDYRVAQETAWMLGFQANSIATQWKIHSLAAANCWRIQASSTSCPAEVSSPSDLAVIAVPHDLKSAPMFTWDTELCDGRLQGTARLNLKMSDVFASLPCSSNADLNADSSMETVANAKEIDTVDAEEDWIAFQVTGKTTEPEIRLQSELPASFVESITRSIERRLLKQQSETEEKLAAQLAEKVNVLQQRVATLSANGIQAVAKQQGILADMHSQIEKSLQARDVYEYARLPGKTPANR